MLEKLRADVPLGNAKGAVMEERVEPMDDAAPTHYTCVDCGASIPMVGAEPSEFLIAKRGEPTHRVLMTAGSEVHRCRSVFLMGTF
jgi:hypothetical protein